MSESASTTSTAVNEPQTENVTEEERKALIAKNNELADAILEVYNSFPIPKGLNEMDADEESRVVKEFNRKRAIAAAPAVAEYNKWKSQLKPHAIRAARPIPTPEQYQKFLDDLPQGCCWNFLRHRNIGPVTVASSSHVVQQRLLQTATPKKCYVCFKPTPIVLATINTVDFLYVCESHLKDRGFASQIQEEAAKPAVSAEDIAKAKAEWEEKQRLKKEKEKEKEDKAKDDKSKDDGSKEKPKSPAPVSPTTTPSSPPATHLKYALHRDFYTMRQDEHRKRRQTAQAKDLAPRLPGAPRGAV